jgi:hypothetical protein
MWIIYKPRGEESSACECRGQAKGAPLDDGDDCGRFSNTPELRGGVPALSLRSTKLIR